MLGQQKKEKDIKYLKLLVKLFVCIVIGLYVGTIILLNIPYVQHHFSMKVTKELSSLFQTRVHIGNIDLGLLNRAIIDDVQLFDRSDETLLEAQKLSVRFDPLSLLLDRQLTIHSVQLFGLKVNLTKDTPETLPNYQFLLDTFASSDTTSTSSLNLRINSILVRNGDVRYTVNSSPETPGRFNAERLHINNLRANISLKALAQDSINATVRQLSFTEQSGFYLKQLALKVMANRDQVLLSRFVLELPDTHLVLDSIMGGFRQDSLGALRTFAFKGGIADSYITLRDIASFVPSLSSFESRMNLQAKVAGTMNDITLSELQISSPNRDVSIRANGKIKQLFSGVTPLLEDVAGQVDVTTTGMHFLFRNLEGDDNRIPPVLIRLGNVRLTMNASGPLDNLTTRMRIHTVPGVVDSHLTWDNRKERMTYIGSIRTEEFDLGGLTGDEDFGKVTFGIDVNGKTSRDSYPESMIKGVVSSLEYKNYTYHDITLDGYSVNGGYDGLLTLHDPNGDLYLYGSLNAAKTIPAFNLTASLKNFRPHNLNLSDRYDDTDISMNLTANFSGNTLDNIEGRIDLDSLLMIAPTDYYFMENLRITSHRGDETRQIAINSDFMNGNIEGEINFATLPESFKRIMHLYVPSLVTFNDKRRHIANNFTFDVSLNSTDLIAKLFDIRADLHASSTLKGYFNEASKKLRVEGYFPNFTYDGQHYESGMLLCENPSDEMKCRIRVTRGINEVSMVNFSVEARAKEDRVQTSVKWGNNEAVTYSGNISAITEFWKTEARTAEESYLQAKIDIDPSNIILNDTVWNLHPSHIDIDSGRVYVERFLFEHDDQYLQVKGKLTDSPEDSLIVNLNKIELGYLFNVLDFHPVDFKGLASGEAYLSNLFDVPMMNTRLFVKDFTFNDGLMGNMVITGEWDPEKGIYLNADIREENISQTLVKGYVSPVDETIDLHFDADSTSLTFLNTYTGEIFRNVRGRTSGRLHLYGTFEDLNLIGDVIADASAHIDVLNIPFSLRRDSVKLRYNQIVFDNIRIYDRDGHEGTLNGVFNHEHLGGNLSYDFRIDTENFLLYNGRESDDLSFYGTVYGTGHTRLQGNSGSMNVDTNIRTDDKTEFVYNAATPEEIISNEFITFVDRTPRREIDEEKYGFRLLTTEEKEEEETTDIRVNFQVEVTPEASIRVIVDPVSDDYVSVRGNGSLRANFFNKGDFRLYGTYTLDYGLYKLSLQEVIHKEFQLQPGGTVVFSGDPDDGIMDVQAVYTVNSASLNDLAPGASFTNNSVRVNCVMNLTGRIFSPDIDFDIELPTVSEEEREILRSYISTDEQMEMQIIYLLGIGRFYTYDYNSGTDSDSGSSSAMSSLISSTLSGQLNNMLSQVINSNNWNFGTNLSTGTNGWSDMEVEGMLSGRLLNNRLLINGNFGYRDNPLATTNFIGDFDVQWLLTPSGEISLKGYNQTNDRYFTKATLTTQGIGIIFKRDFDTWFELFRRKLKRDRSKQLESTSVEGNATK